MCPLLLTRKSLRSFEASGDFVPGSITISSQRCPVCVAYGRAQMLTASSSLNTWRTSTLSMCIIGVRTSTLELRWNKPSLVFCGSTANAQLPNRLCNALFWQ